MRVELSLLVHKNKDWNIFHAAMIVAWLIQKPFWDTWTRSPGSNLWLLHEGAERAIGGLKDKSTIRKQKDLSKNLSLKKVPA